MKHYSRTAMALLAVFAGVIILERAHTREEPIECDTANLSVFAHEWKGGRALYSDLWINKPPGGILTFAAAEMAAGRGSATTMLLAVLVTVATLLGIYSVTVCLTQDRASGLWAAALWTLINGNPYLEANQPMLEGLVNACWCWALSAALQSDSEETPSFNLAVSGGFLYLATFYKQNMIIPNGLFALAILGWRRMGGRRRFSSLALDGVTLLSPTLLFWTATFAVYGATHRFYDIWGALITSSLEYTQTTPFGKGNLISNVIVSLKPSVLAACYRGNIFYSVLPLAAVALGGFLWTRSWKDRRWILVAGYGASAWLGMALPGRFAAHYYQLLLPPLVIAAGLSIGVINRQKRVSAMRWGAFAWPCLLIALVSYRELKFYKLPADDWSRLKYGEIYITVKRMGEEIGRNLLPQETFYEIGYDPGLYYYSRHSPPTGMLFADDWESGSSADVFMNRIIRDLAATQPELFITTRFWLASEKNRRLPLAQWCLERYRPLPGDAQHGPYQLFALRGGNLERRLRAKT